MQVSQVLQWLITIFGTLNQMDSGNQLNVVKFGNLMLLVLMITSRMQERFYILKKWKK